MAKNESLTSLCFAISVIEIMGAVKSRQQTGDTSWHQTMSAFSKRRKFGSSANQDKDKDHSALTEQTQFSSPRKTDMKNDDSLSFASSQQLDESVQISSRFSSNKHLPSTLAGVEQAPMMQSSLCSNSVRSFQYSSDQFQASQNKKVEEMLYQHLNLDTHPAVTRLQNEQNQRLEGMEQRMNKIRKNAQQEAERRKFAHLFRARTEEKLKTEKLLKEASVALQLFKKERQMKKSDKDKPLSRCGESDTQNQSVSDVEIKHENDKGDIIPVHIVSAKPPSYNKVKRSRAEGEQPLMWLLQPVERFELNGIVLWLVLPFLLPLLLLLHLLRHLSPSSDYHSSKKN